MTRTKLICLGLFCISILVMMAIVFKGFYTRIEHFESAAPGSASCPTGFTMYMYEGSAYCCNGTVNRDANTVEKTCLPPVTASENSFCTLSDSHNKIPNCSALKNDVLKRLGSAICPKSKPNYCSKNICCTSTLTPDSTDCSTRQSGFCESNPDIFRTLGGGQTSCQYQRIKEMDTCPVGTTMTDLTPGGSLAGSTIYGCTTMTSTCYTTILLNSLKAAGKDTTGLISCTDAAAMEVKRVAEATVNAVALCPVKYIMSADGVPPTQATTIIETDTGPMKDARLYLGQRDNLIIAMVEIKSTKKIEEGMAHMFQGRLSDHKLTTVEEAIKMIRSLQRKGGGINASLTIL
jgi:hypothetical protein